MLSCLVEHVNGSLPEWPRRYLFSSRNDRSPHRSVAPASGNIHWMSPHIPSLPPFLTLPPSRLPRTTKRRHARRVCGRRTARSPRRGRGATTPAHLRPHRGGHAPRVFQPRGGFLRLLGHSGEIFAVIGNVRLLTLRSDISAVLIRFWKRKGIGDRGQSAYS